MDRELALARFDEAQREARDAYARGDEGAARAAEEAMESLTVPAWRGMGTEG